MMKEMEVGKKILEEIGSWTGKKKTRKKLISAVADFAASGHICAKAPAPIRGVGRFTDSTPDMDGGIKKEDDDAYLLLLFLSLQQHLLFLSLQPQLLALSLH